MQSCASLVLTPGSLKVVLATTAVLALVQAASAAPAPAGDGSGGVAKPPRAIPVTQAGESNGKRFSLKALFAKRRPQPAADPSRAEAAEPVRSAERRAPVPTTSRQPRAEPRLAATSNSGSGQERKENSNSKKIRGLKWVIPFFSERRDDRPTPAEPAGSPVDRPSKVPGEAPAPGRRADRYVVTEDRAEFYRDGPLQVQAPEHILSDGDLVSLVVWRKSWCDVRLESGEVGVVATDQLRKAKASDLPVEPLVIEALENLDRVAAAAVSLDEVPLLEPLLHPPLPERDLGADGLLLDPGTSPLLLPPLPE